MSRRTRSIVLAAVLALAALAACAPAALAETSFCPPGSGAGECQGPQGVAAGTDTDRVFVVDQDNNRVNVFESDGSFAFAFGWDIVSSGPNHVAGPSEEQTVTLGANTTGGNFKLRFDGQFTAAIAFDAPATGSDSVEAALNALPTIGGVGGSVSVSGSPSGPYTVTFGGVFAGEGVAEMTANATELIVSGGAKSVTVATAVQGGAFELCADPADVCKAGSPGPGPGQFSGPTAIAVDNDPLSSSYGDIYVVDRGNFRVQKFDPTGAHLLSIGGGTNSEAEGSFSVKIGSGIFVGVGPGGIVHVLDNLRPATTFQHRIQRFEADGTLIAPQQVLFEGNGPAKALAVDSEASFWVAGEGGGASSAVRRYTAGGAELCAVSSTANSLAVDATDHVYALQVETAAQGGDSFRVIAEYEPDCEVAHRFGYGQIKQTIFGLAFNETATGSLIGSEGSEGVRYFSPPPLGPIVAPPSVEADPVGNVRATLVAEVNPEGKATEYRFDYVDEQSFEAEGGFASPNTKSSPTAPVGAEGFNLKTVKAQVGCEDAVGEAESGNCLTPDTTYRFRAVATNADNPTGAGEGTAEGSFTTKAPLEILATYATEVGADAARLNAEVNPLGIPATGFFEYVEEATYEQSGFDEALIAPAGSPLDFGASEGPVTRSATIAPLDPGTTYRYRVVVDNPLIDPVIGPERSLATFGPDGPVPCPANEIFRAGPSALLPDCRAYEMVSPLDKANGDTIVLLAPGDSPATLDQSSLSGEKLTYGTYRAFGDAESAPYTSQYVAEREAGTGWANHAIAPPRERLVLEGLNMIDTEFKAFSPDLCQVWHRTVAEPVLAPGGVAGYPNLYRRLDQASGCGGESHEAVSDVAPPNAGPQSYSENLEFQGASADGQAAIFIANDKLSAEAPAQPASCVAEGAGCVAGLYLKRAEAGLEYLCVLPGGGPATAPCSAGTGLAGTGAGDSRQANVANAISADGSRVYWTDAASGPGRIYLRLPAADQTLDVSAEAEGLSGTSSSQYWWAAEDGSRAIFTTGGDLYEFEVADEETTLLAEGVSGVMGASEDASRVYFASSQALDPESAEGRAPVAGEANLYLAAGGEVEFIMTLAASDANVALGPINLVPVRRASRVSPDGLHAAWMSAAAPTGYDNRDAKSGEPDAEVFRYDAGSGELVCASCNPSGARPAGEEVDLPAGKIWAAAQLPGWENTLYASRVLADDGSRLYFESTDALVLRDTNGTTDVYQWEEAGAGGCEHSDPTYSEAAKGCIDLISTGQSARESTFVDASASGDDVFFATLQSLVGQDYGLVDIYDARVDGGLPSPPPPAVQCEGEACQNPAPAPSRASFSSAAYAGPGDLRSGPSGQRRCHASARRAKRLARRAKLLRRVARHSSGPTAKRRRLAASQRKARQARKLTRNAKRCRAGNRDRERSGR